MKQSVFILFFLVSTLVWGQNEYALAENYYRQGEYEKAIVLYKKLQEKSPYNTTLLKRLITCYQETNQFDLVESFLKNLIDKNPRLTYLNVELGYNFQRQRKKELAETYYNAAIEGISENASIGGITGRLFKNNNLLDKALLSYKATMDINPKSNYGFQIAQIYGEKGDFDKMFNAYVDLVDKNEGYLNTVQRYSSRYLSDDPKDKNNISFKRALLKKSVANPKNVWNELLSWLFSKQNEYSKALIQEKALFRRNPELLENIVFLGKFAFDNKDYDATKECFQFVLENTNEISERVNAELYLLKCSVALEEDTTTDLFKAFFKQYGVNSNTLSVQIDYADYLTFQKNDAKKAEEILDTALSIAKTKFQKARIKLRLGDIYVFTNRFNKALINFSQVQTALKNHPLSQEARYKVAKTSFYKGDFKWAMTQLKVLKGSTTQLIANDAVDLFLTISDNIPRDSLPTGLHEYAKASLLGFQNRTTEAVDVYSKVLVDYKGQSIEDEALYQQALLFRKIKSYDASIKNLLQLIDLDKTGIFADDAYFLLAEIYRTNLNLPEKASEYYQKIIFDFPSSIYLVDARKYFRELRGDNLK